MTLGGEEAAELIATIRGDHVTMKQWFMGDSAEAKALRETWGDYPSLWKEVLNWKGWKEARKAYLTYQQTSGTYNESSNRQSEGESVPRKRKSRWGGTDSSDAAPSARAPRRSRWSSSASPNQPPPVAPPPPRPSLPGLPGMPSNLPPRQRQEMEGLQATLREVNERLQHVEQEAERVDALPVRERSPSPPPVYGPDGKRKNTRAVRWRERLSGERHELLEKLMSLNPATRHNSLFRRKRSKKIPIPVEDHPNYNFIGLIIGPRGKTQKELESKTGCKIAIRGKGSVKEGARGRRDGKVMEGDYEPLHVVITGEDQKSVDAATDMIQQMLVVIDDEKNVHKQAQLRELALLNGTLKEEEFCQICAEKGHRAFECPKRFAGNKNKIQVKCAICGDTSHPTRDCTQNQMLQQGQHVPSGKNAQELDSDYANFMAELDGKKVEPITANNESDAVAPETKPAGVTILKPASAAVAPVNATVPDPIETGNMIPPSSASLPLPPPPTNLPPMPVSGPPNAILPPPPKMHVTQLPPPPGQGHLPPPPPNLPSAAPGMYNQQPAANNYNHTYNQPPPQQRHQQDDETSGWDYKSFYSGQTGGDAGGFNWWDQN
mmetsp:Transcript_24981/g.37748  ORF Transcript_24981/g.37748 Transcript_24981/m.37748 type:complete len:605 (+) Transcript_24981:79-1893(+)|eukprot:CAMPEP_0194210094 /NCGR_PEP_ID=MMETSP0156-20130528/7998_1 /TAXON_ID=33649 /ORGANISM="Thalassionema nitzschioides, Strain L26-B" /LENGTH=604 /DNA_ID=CAMNT_0038937397 /DNA_START=44 /DNA_END=1858 /DNA_ORIENTATION=+